MFRLAFGSMVALVLLPLHASAQVPRGGASGVGSFGGGFRTPNPSLAAPSAGAPLRPPSFFSVPGYRGNTPRVSMRSVGPFVPGRTSFGGFGGFYPLYPYSGYGFGGYYGGGFYGDGYPYLYSGPATFDDPGAYSLFPPDPLAAPAPQTQWLTEMSGQFPATLDIEFPAPAKVWLDGKEVAGDPAAKRTLTSKVLRPGETFTFHVRAEWKSNGRTYEYTRDVPLKAGEKSRLLVVSGTAVTNRE